MRDRQLAKQQHQRLAAREDSYTGISVATSSQALEDLIPTPSASSADASQTNYASDNSRPAGTSGIAVSVVNSLLAQTASFSSFTYTSFSPGPSTSMSAVESPAPSPTSQSAAADEGDDLEDEIAAAGKKYAESMMGDLLPTMTLEVVLEPTQVNTDVNSPNPTLTDVS